MNNYIEQFYQFDKNGKVVGIDDLAGIVDYLLNGIKIDGKKNKELPPLCLRKISGRLQLIDTKEENGKIVKFRSFVTNAQIDNKLNTILSWAKESQIVALRKKILLTLEDKDEREWIEKGFIRKDIIAFKNNVIIQIKPDGKYEVIEEKKADRLIPLNIIETNFNPKVDRTFFNETMRQIFSDINGNFYQDKLDCFQQFIGYCLLPTSELQASLVLYGEGSNGKGVLDESIAKAFGRKNVSGEKISSLVSNRFALANLLNKLINIESDGGEISINESSTLKSIISGDEVSIEVKNEQGSGQKVQLYARMLICTNHIPKILDDSAAWDRRIVGITLLNKFGVDPIFKAKTLKNEFLESLIMFAIEGIKKLYDNGRKFFKDPHFEQSLESLKEQLQPIYKYCKENNFFDCALGNIDIKKLFMKGVVYNDLYLDKYKYWETFCQEENITEKYKYTTFQNKVINFVKIQITKNIKKKQQEEQELDAFADKMLESRKNNEDKEIEALLKMKESLGD